MSPTRKKARLSAPDLSSQSSRLVSPLSSSKAEARRKRKKAIEEALAQLSPPRGRVKSLSSVSIDRDDVRSLFNATNVFQASTQNRVPQAVSGSSQISNAVPRSGTEINPFVSQASSVPHVVHEDQDADLWDDITELDGAFLEALDETPPITDMGSTPAPNANGLVGLPAVTFLTGRLRPLEFDPDVAAKAQKVIEEIGTEDDASGDSSSLPPSSQSFSLIQRPLPEFKTPFKTSHIPEAAIALSQAYPRGSQRPPSMAVTPSKALPSTTIPPPSSSSSTPRQTNALETTASSRNSTPLLRPPASLSTPNAKLPARLGGYRARPSTSTFVTPFKPGFRPGGRGRSSSTQEARPAPAPEIPHQIASDTLHSIVPVPQLPSVSKGERVPIPLQPDSVLNPSK